MPEDREERHVKAFIDGLRRAVETDMPTEDVGRLAAAALGADDADEDKQHEPPPEEAEPKTAN